MRFFRSYFALCLAILFSSGLRANAQANVIENQTVFIYADTVNGSDSNPGTASLPFKTIQAAINYANKYNRADVGTKVIINPGTYREYVNIAGYSITPAVLTVQAATPGTVTISGSNVLTGWTQQTPTIYSTSWTANLGYCAIPSGWPTNFAPIGQRAEMVYVNGTPLTEIMSYADLVPGTFYVDDATSTMYVSPASSTNMATAVVEAAVRPQTLTVSNRTNVVLRGLSMHHGANCFNSSAAAVSNSTNVLVDSVQSEWNNWGGFGVFMSTDVTVQNSIASYNGGIGFMGNEDVSTLFNFNESDFNNWRGAQAAFYDWGMGGTKLFALHGATIQNHFAYNNQAQGLWFDTDNKNITVNTSTLSGNLLAALQMERNEGPTALENSYLCSSNAGVNILTSANFTMQNNVLYNNGAAGRTDEAQIFLAGQTGGINVKDWQTGQVYDLFTTGTVLTGNTIVDAVTGQILTGTYLDASDWAQFASSLTATDNTYYDPNTTSALRVVNGKLLTLPKWQSAVNADFSSTWAPPATSPAAACTAPAPAYADFNLNADNVTYAMTSGKVVSTIRLNSFGFGAVNLSVEGTPAGVNANLSQQSLVSGTATVTFTSSLAATAQTVPITVWATSGSRVHSVTFYLQVTPFATPQTAPKITWATPAAIPYGTALSPAQLNATLSVSGSCTYSPAAGTVLSAGTQALTATCTPTDIVDYSTPAPATVSVLVTPVPLAVTASSPSVAYGAAAPAITPGFTGFVNNDSNVSLTKQPTCTTTYTVASAAGSSPATNCSGAADSNYSISYVAGAVTVRQASQTISFAQPPASVPYGSSPIALVATSTSGVPVTFAGTTGVCNISGSTLNIVAAGSCTVTANQAGNGNYSAATAVSHSITVNPASLTITASSPSVVYGAAVPAITPAFSGFVNGDSSASLTTQPVCSTAYTTTSGAGSNPATTCSGAVGANYSISYVSGTAIITAAPQSIAFALPAVVSTYGASPLTLSAKATSGASVTFAGTDGVCNVSGTTLTIVGAGSCTVTASQSGNDNYSAAAAVTRSINVNPAALTITASNATVAYGAAAPAVTAAFSGFVNGDSNASLTAQPVCTTAYTATSGAESNPATSCSGAAASNYSITYVPGTVTITAAPQSITFSQPRASLSYGVSAIVLSATASSGDAVTFTGTTGVCNVSGTTLTIVGAGSCIITASQTGNSNYLAATPVSHTLAVSPAILTITASSSAVTYGAAAPAILPSFSGFVGGDSSASLTAQPTCTTAYTTASAAGSNPATSCSGATDPNYSVVYVSGAVTVSQASLTITASSATVTYGAAVPVISPSYSGFINGQSIASLTSQPTCTTAYTVTSPAGSSPATGCQGAIDSNYVISYVPGAVSVKASPIPTATPVLAQAGALGAATESVVISDSTPGSTIYYTTDGSTPTTSSSVYSGAIPLLTTTTVNAIALATGSPVSAIATGVYTIQPPPINFNNGFPTASGMQLNGSAAMTGSALALTSGKANQAGSAFYAKPVNVSSFTSSFTIQQTNATADGMTFVIQNASTGAKSVGPSGSGLGYSEGPTQAGAILHSIAIKFDLYDNSGEGPNSTGLYTNGAHPTLPAIDLTQSGVNLHSGNPMNVLLQYDGQTLTMTITDTVTSKSFVNSWAINIPSIVGSSTAYVGFTGASGGSTAVQQVLNWVF